MEFNFENFKIKNNRYATQLSYTASNISAQNKKDYSPSFGTVLPKVMMGLELFTWRTLMVLLKAGNLGSGILVMKY
jgi:hypothetical protein